MLIGEVRFISWLLILAVPYDNISNDKGSERSVDSYQIVENIIFYDFENVSRSMNM